MTNRRDAWSTLSSETTNEDDSLEDFEKRSVELLAQTKMVFVSGDGPAVIVMAEMPGISPQVARFARWVREAGFTVYMPSLFGRDGAFPRAEEGVAVLKRACVSAEFRAFAANESSPVTVWLRALAKLAHDACGGPGVGAIGMCFTGNFALSMMLESSVIAPVLCQPSLPFHDLGALQIAPDEVKFVRERLDREGLEVRAYRFADDAFCTKQRFAAYAEALGERFIGKELPTSAANTNPPPFFKHVVGTPHSVVTAHLIDAAGEPTLAARDEILAFFVGAIASSEGSQWEHTMTETLEIVGRTSSHFTRVAVMLAYELNVPVLFVPVYDLASLDAAEYAGNPALKIPTLRRGDALLFGTENICRALASESASALRIVWTEQLTSTLAKSAQEMIWHAMSAQVQLILATYVGKIPPENGYIAKVREGYEGALRWLDDHLAEVLATLPEDRALSLLELTLYCLVEHIAFRPMVALEPYAALRAFSVEFGKRPSAVGTPYRMDRRPA